MFSYYGSKSSIVRHYPYPLHERIIEPFAGSARYALCYHLRDVWINDLNPVIYGIWHWLIHEATVNDVDAWPDLNAGDDLRNVKYLSGPERDLLGFIVGKGRSTPGNVATGFGYRPGRNLMAKTRKLIAWYLPRIKHWRITNKSYSQIKINPQSTWFIDPPYNNPAGNCYPNGASQINYQSLAGWCNSRNGQLIVCEGNQANWLPFRPLVNHGGIWSKDSTELIYTK